MPNTRALVFAPAGAPDAAAMPNRTERPAMTVGQAALVSLMERYLEGLLDPFVSLLEIHKLMYFLKAAGEPLPNLKFEENVFGPYSPSLRHSLIRMENNLTRGYGEGKDTPTKAIELLPDATEEAKKFLRDRRDTQERMDRVAQLIEGYEDSYGMELLSSVHWVMQQDVRARESADAAAKAVQAWSPRKRRLLQPAHLQKAWSRLREQGWDAVSSL